MKNILEKKVSKVAGNVVMWIVVIIAGLAPIICADLVEFIELFGLTLVLASGIIAVDVAIHEEKQQYLEKKPDRYVSGTVNLNW